MVADILQINADQVTLDTSPENNPAWDSFGHLAIVASIEEEYEINFDFEEMFRITSMETLLEIIAEKTGLDLC